VRGLGEIYREATPLPGSGAARSDPISRGAGGAVAGDVAGLAAVVAGATAGRGSSVVLHFDDVFVVCLVMCR